MFDHSVGDKYHRVIKTCHIAQANSEHWQLSKTKSFCKNS